LNKGANKERLWLQMDSLPRAKLERHVNWINQMYYAAFSKINFHKCSIDHYYH